MQLTTRNEVDIPYRPEPYFKYSAPPQSATRYLERHQHGNSFLGLEYHGKSHRDGGPIREIIKVDNRPFLKPLLANDYLLELGLNEAIATRKP